MRKNTPSLILLSAALALTSAAWAWAGPSSVSQEALRTGPWEWMGVSRVVAIGDLHGGFDKLLRLLKGADLVDDELAWTGGTDHLLVAGDFLDRGPGEREIMDLLRRLEGEASAAGGRVHVLLGNHEVMTLTRDTRYVSDAGFRSFARDETKAERRAGWRAYSRLRVGQADLAKLRRDFQERYPAGFFARQRLFEPDGDYGSWLMSLPAIVKIDGVLYVHGGLTEDFAALGLSGINQRVRDALRRRIELRRELECAGVLSPVQGLAEILATTAEVAASEGHPHAMTASALQEATRDPALGSSGPLWYRGTALEDERIERRILETALELLDAEALVIAHTYTGGNKITSRFHGKLYRVDHGILDSSRPLALVVERGTTLVLDPAAGAKLTPQRELPMGRSLLAGRADLTDDQSADLLRGGEITHSVELGRGSSRPRLLVLERAGDRTRGIFKTVAKTPASGPADRYQHEVAAFALDQELGLGMVPPTVLRSIEGREGSLQSWVEGAIDRQAAREFDLASYESAASLGQVARAELFDALIGNPGREPDDMLLTLAERKIYLIDHSQAFSTSTEVAWTAATSVEPELYGRLRQMNRATLSHKLGALLDADQIDALLARRDAILDRLERPATAAAETAAIASD